MLSVIVVCSCEKAERSPEPEPAPQARTLETSIALETLGGTSTVLIPRGTILPTTHTEVFSTATDNQTSVELHVVQGEKPAARDNRSLGKFQLIDISPAPRGVPQIEVTFAVDAAGALTVTARDRATGDGRAIRIEKLAAAR